MQEDFQLSQIGQISINVHDLDRAVGFYGDSLGLPLLFQVPKMAFFRCGEITLMLGLPEAPEFDYPSSILYFQVDDIEAAHRAMNGRGVEFRGEPHRIHQAEDHELWMAFFRDSEGNTLALMSRKPREG